MPTPALPPRVVSGELITSQWGNLVADEIAGTDLVLGGATPGGTIQPGTQAEVARIDLPQGVWIVWYEVLVTSSAFLDVAIRCYTGGATWMDVTVTAPINGPVAKNTGHAHVYAEFSGGANSVSFNIINNGAAAAGCYADPTNHRLHAMQGRKP